MTPYHTSFVPFFLTGCLIAAIVSFLAGRSSGCFWPGLLLSVGTLAFWAAIFFGADLGYRAWQSMPDPPDEAFSDASVLGALVLGWLPGGIFCLTIFGLVRGARWALTKANPDAFPPPFSQVENSDVEFSESGNPYQSMNNGKKG